MTPITCIEDLRQLAERRVPRAFFQYVDSGSYAEETFRANRADMERIKLRQRVLVECRQARSLAPRSSGRKSRCRSRSRRSGCAACSTATAKSSPREAANEAGIPFCMSTMSICSMEQVAEATKKPFWFQVYVIRDRGFIADLIARAKAANCFGAGADRRSSGAGPAPSRHQERHDGAAEDQARQCHRHPVQAALGDEHAERARARPSAISPAT